MLKIKVLCDVDDALVVWNSDSHIADCVGFSIERRLNGGAPETLRNYVGWEDTDTGSKPSTVWPFQRWKWTDHFVSRGDHVAYRVTAMIGQPGTLAPGEHSDWTPEVGVDVGADVGAHFNRGILASQWVSKLLGKDTVENHPGQLLTAVRTPGNKIRNGLSGELRDALLTILADAKATGDDIYVALFELADPELEDALIALGQHAHVVLANGTHEKPKGLPMKDENEKARAKLHNKVDLYDRMIKSGLSHNKFMVIVHAGKPRAVWTGSTNWTPSGLCTQANNALVIEDEKLAGAYLTQWGLLRDAKNVHPSSLRTANGTPKNFSIGNPKHPGTIWFTPLAGRLDLAAATKLIDEAHDAIFFLMFNPGPRETLFTSIQNRIARDKANPPAAGQAYVRGVINQDPGGKKAPVLLYDERGKVPKGLEVVLPAAIDDPFARWNKELLKAPSAHAMIHSKVIVLDPEGTKPVVMTGSHNFGPAASGKNDDNLVIVEGDRALAEAYTVNILQAYGNYRWRENQAQAKPGKFRHLEHDATWQNWALNGDGQAERKFWWG